MRAAWILAGLWAALCFATAQGGDEVRGKDVFQRRCGGCHSLDKPMEGPMLRGVYGRRAGSTDFSYSDALKKAGIKSGNDMEFRVPSADERRDVIAYLKSSSH
jgi:cytochrome c